MEKYRRLENLIDGEIDNHQVIMHINNGKYFGLNPVGKRIWTLIEEPKTLEEIISILLLEYNISPEQCETEVKSFLERCVECEIVIKERA